MTSVEHWSGVFPAALSMFNADGSLDEPATTAHVRSLVDDGAHGIVVGGTSGEFVTMTDVERIRVVELAVDAVGGRVPVIAGTGAPGTAQTIALTAASAGAGASGALVIMPFYLRPNREEVLGHFRAVGAASPIPVFLYNNPGNSGTDPVDARDIGRLYADGLLHGVKSTFPTVHQVVEAIDETGPDFRAFYGGFFAPLSGLAEGAHGWISGVLNVALREAIALWEAVQKGDLVAARAAAATIRQYRYLYSRFPSGEVNDLALYRQILAVRGRHGGHSRAPIRDLDPSVRPQLERLLAAIG
ncbi:dihydrodipicolinate synthase family protein [Dactylosporangium sp. CA-233914]|uniref:dihydrodipicolinate synthase family protein n=1 Tax=Dactylosporangium sp. CA-233914 TaxID=3239934 RepID=UPI003D91BEBF